MKAKELMIGDWVRNALLNEVFKMNTTSMRNMCWDEDNGTARYNIEPIPLTEEILKANGFHKLDEVDYEYVYSRDDVTFCVCKRDLTCPYIRFGGYFFCNTNYVHELQRVLRCCGLFDLADNFKTL